MYFVCRWIDLGQKEAESLDRELAWLIDLPNRSGRVQPQGGVWR